MDNTIVGFKDRFFDLDMDDQERGLAIGGYKSAWLVDLVTTYILEISKDQFEDKKYHGIYRDDGFMIFDGIKLT